MLADRGANLLLAPVDVDAGLAQAPAARHLHLSGYALLDGASREAGRYAPAEPAEVVDPTGAGDAFAAGLLAAWLAGAGPAEALRAGALFGARAVAVVGGRPVPGG